MVTRWQTRRKELQDLRPEVLQLVREQYRDSQDPNVRQGLSSDDAGTLLDLARVGKQDSSPHAAVDRLAELQLSYTRDFQVLHTISSQAQVGCTVAVVYPRDLGTSKRVYAAKTMTKSSAMKLEGQTSILHERNILVQARQQRNAYITRITAACQDENSLTILLEYLPAGDLGLLLEERKTFPEDWARTWTAECLNAILWLHSIGFAHRDIKPANLLLTLDGHVKLADFASCALTTDVNGAQKVLKRYCMTPVGTVDYIAPDILLAHEHAIEDSSFDEDVDTQEPGMYDSTVDFWSTGVMLYEMITGTLPFFATSIPDTYERIVHHSDHLRLDGRRWTDNSKDLVRNLLTDCQGRLGCKGPEEIRSHAFFRSIDWDKLYRTPGPLKPQIRILPEPGNQTTIEPVSKGFDFSALFSSPGLSILRPEEPEDSSSLQAKWVGFTYLPDANEFDTREDDVRRSRLLKMARSLAGPQYPCTPARSSASPNDMMDSSNRRKQQNAAALAEVVSYGILKTAKKASAATVKKQRDAHKRDKLTDLELRHKRLTDDIGSIESRYRDLMRKAGAPVSTDVA